MTLKQKIKFLAVSVFSCLLLGVLCLVGFFYAVYFGAFGKLPSAEELKNISNYQASEVYSADSVLLARYFVENRSESKYEEISPKLIEALIATEDARFYEHSGVDHRSLMRVLFKSIILGQNAGGGSTLSQQLVKNLFGRERYGLLTMPVVKIKESVIANRMEDIYSKEEILTLYLNTVSFGEDTYGIKTACKRFFNATPKDIALENAAVLIGMLKAPTSYNPRLNPEKSLIRRNTVLGQMRKEDYITDELYEELSSKSISLNYTRIAEKDETGYLKDYLQPQLEQWLAEQNELNDTDYDLYTSGLKIYTSLNAQLQHYAVMSVEKHLRKLDQDLKKDLTRRKFFSLKNEWFRNYLKSTRQFETLKESGLTIDECFEQLDKKKVRTIPVGFEMVDSNISFIDSVSTSLGLLQAGFMVCDPHNGDVLAWVGGRSYEQTQYNHITSKRQAGSVFKPILYAKALSNGRKPCDYISNRQIVYTEYDDWQPKNSDGNYEGRYSLKGALTNSVNTISVKLCMESGIDSVVSFAHKLGIEDSITRKPSLCLGVDNFSLYNLIEVYSGFANKGERTKLNLVKSIVDKDNSVIYQSEVFQERVLDEAVALDLTQMLQNVAQNGTARRLKYIYGINDGVAGKTGTTQNHKDGWFMGYTPTWLGGVWVGADNPSIHFSNIKDGQGANMALPIWANFYKFLEGDDQFKKYVNQSFDFEEEIECEDFLEDTKLMKFFKGTGPRKSHATGHEKSKAQRKGFRLFKKRQ